MNQQFRCILQGEPFSEDLCNRLYEAGCDDGSVSSSGGVLRIDFDREADTIDDAIRSAIKDIRKTGLDVLSIEMDAQQPSLQV